ncbi:MAG: division/cell wall cluster transcriptional repressor MraZ [Rhodobacteraceae bacterium]|nr:division/cell wall cluster transcriptional repressor MraZ [Paracoccaceae bacterium]
MGRTFRGDSQNKVDSKGRVSIPAHFRRVIEAGDPNWNGQNPPELVIVYGDHRRKCLECFTVVETDKLDHQIRALPSGSKEKKILQYIYHSKSRTTSIDDTGRLVLPAPAREKAQITSEALFIGAGDTFQIWNPEIYEAEELQRAREWIDDLPEDFDPLSFLSENRAG